MAALKLRRHGDVLIKTRDGFSIPAEAALAPMQLLHKGDNHSHSVAGGKALHATHEGTRYLRVVEALTVDHQEHGKGDIPPGDYWVEIKSEYDHWAEESREVVD